MSRRDLGIDKGMYQSLKELRSLEQPMDDITLYDEAMFMYPKETIDNQGNSQITYGLFASVEGGHVLSCHVKSINMSEASKIIGEAPTAKQVVLVKLAKNISNMNYFVPGVQMIYPVSQQVARSAGGVIVTGFERYGVNLWRCVHSRSFSSDWFFVEAIFVLQDKRYVYQRTEGVITLTAVDTGVDTDEIPGIDESKIDPRDV